MYYRSFRFGLDGPSSFVTTAHRQIIRARDDNWGYFLNDLDKNFARLNEHFGKLRGKEVAWEATWQELVESLKLDNLSAEK